MDEENIELLGNSLRLKRKKSITQKKKNQKIVRN